MPDLSTLLTFITASVILLVVPGPTIALIISKSMSHGKRIAVPMVLGIAAGGTVAATLALAGVSAILMGSAAAFNALKLVGALYLFYLGFKLLTAKPQDFDISITPDETPFTTFRDGFLVMVFNPKGILFFAAFVPQFITPELAYTTQATVFVMVFVLTGMVVDTCYALLADRLGRVIRSPRVQTGVNRTAGETIIGAGVATLFSRQP